MSDLMSCPFCGGRWTIAQEPPDNGHVAGLYYAFHADGGRCVRFTGHFLTREAAVEAINRRMTTPAPPSSPARE
jgi:hypothetical protein